MEMQGVNGTGVIEIPDPGTLFQLEDKVFSLDLIEALRECNRIRAACEGKINFEHLDLFRAWVFTLSNLELTLSQADWLWDYVEQEYVAQKKTRQDGRTSPRSTGSTPFD